MPDTAKLIHGLECCRDSMNDNPLARCGECPYNDEGFSVQECRSVLCKDALEVLRKRMTAHGFFDWLACSVVLADDFETNPGFYREVICRKLVRLGMLKLEDDKYVLPDPTKWREEVSGDA